MKKTIGLSVIADAIEQTFSEWQAYYNVVSGEVKELPDSSNVYADWEDYAEDAEEIEESDDYLRLPNQRDRNDYATMKAFAEAKNSAELLRALQGRRPYRSFKDRAIQLGLIEDYYAFQAGAYVRLAREWCEGNEIPYVEDEKAKAALAAARNAVPQPEPEPSITVLLSYTGKDGAARRFAEEMLKSGIVDAIRAEAGNLRYAYFLPMEDPETVLLIDAWVNQAALDLHHASPMMGQIAALREKYDLHMQAERYERVNGATADERFIRK